ncbi:9721_t:CDS:2 [Gigaspora margarita]|uniref:9721_t:CDS:1 n=1 Tax=Gigaspora margarita TaxID=4874 RepID=A0ABN7UM77_GIGMA|nr:9721_t:CDS:2 [Gigaspora margarita]
MTILIATFTKFFYLRCSSRTSLFPPCKFRCILFLPEPSTSCMDYEINEITLFYHTLSVSLGNINIIAFYLRKKNCISTCQRHRRQGSDAKSVRVQETATKHKKRANLSPVKQQHEQEQDTLQRRLARKSRPSTQANQSLLFQ